MSGKIEGNEYLSVKEFKVSISAIGWLLDPLSTAIIVCWLLHAIGNDRCV